MHLQYCIILTKKFPKNHERAASVQKQDQKMRTRYYSVSDFYMKLWIFQITSQQFRRMFEEVQKYVKLTPEDLKKTVILKRQDDIFYLLLNRKMNLFDHDFIRSIDKALTQVEESEGPACLVTVSLDKKHFSGGLDLKYVQKFKHVEDFKYFVLEFIALLGRFASLSIPTIVVVKGAVIAGGCMTSFAHDMIYVVDHALFACNQVDIGLPLPPGMMTTIKRKHPTYQSLRDMTLFGRKFNEKEALQYKMIDGIVNGLEPVIEKANELANYGGNRENFKKLKAQFNKQVIDACFNRQHAVGTVGYVTYKGFMQPKL